MRARLTPPIPRPTLARRFSGCALALALALALAAPPVASAPHHSAQPATKSGPRRAAKSGSRARKDARKHATTRTAKSPSVELPGAIPELPQVDLGTFASLTGPELTGGTAAAVPAGAPVATPAASAPTAGVLDAEAPAESAKPDELPKPFAAFSRSASALLDALTARARSQLGTRYVLGAADPGGALDCSAFTRFAMEALGLRLPRTAAQQAKVGVAVPRDRERLRPGDLLTFGSKRRVSHVGIYLGEGRFIHASVTSGQVIETTFAKNARLLRRWLGARRLLANADSTPATGG